MKLNDANKNLNFTITITILLQTIMRMLSMKKNIFNLQINDISTEELIHYTNTLRGFNFITTPNLQHIVAVNNDQIIFDCYKGAQFIICDSRIVQLLSKIVGQKITHVTPGSDLTKYYFDNVLEPNDNIMIIGSTVSEIKRLSDLYPRLAINHYSPPMGFINNIKETDKTIRAIEEIKPNYLFLAVGFPRQEKLACILKTKIDFDCTAFCIGASIDFLTGKQNRAPLIWQKAHMEWLYRFFQDPKRMFKRYFINSWGIIPILFKEKYRK